MAKVAFELKVVLKYPPWAQAYIDTLASLHRAGFAVDPVEAAQHIVKHSRITVR